MVIWAPHQCMLRAFCELTNLDPKQVMEDLGVTGEELIDGKYHRGFHMDELVRYGIKHNIYLTPIDANPRLLFDDLVYEIRDAGPIGLVHYLTNYPCLILGVTNKGVNHCWHNINRDYFVDDELNRIHRIYIVSIH